MNNTGPSASLAKRWIDDGDSTKCPEE
nr:hypothetical protein [Pseudomonas chlororaphis]